MTSLAKNLKEELRQSVHVLREAALEVTRFVFVNDVALYQLVQHGNHHGKTLCCFFLVGRNTKATNGVARSFVVVCVVHPTFFVGTDALKC